MFYRSIKRGLGKNNLERKCRLLFGLCLVLLLSVSFWWVEHIGESLVKREAMRKGRDLVDSSLLRYHFVKAWETEPGPQELMEEISRDLQTQKYRWQILALDEFPGTEPPGNPDEEAIIRGVMAELQQQLRTRSFQAKREQSRETGEEVSPQEDVAPRPTDETSSVDIQPVCFFRPMPNANEIHYYQPVYWKNSCIRCHVDLEGLDARGRADAALFADPATYPFRVVKVTVPASETLQAIASNRAVLTATGILTLFVAVVVSYPIIRFVVIKPLRHLRDVSNEITRGNMDVQAEVHTNDEFGELADGINRMLHDLAEAQKELRQFKKDL